MRFARRFTVFGKLFFYTIGGSTKESRIFDLKFVATSTHPIVLINLGDHIAAGTFELC